MKIYTIAVCLVILPFSLIGISISMNQSSFSAGTMILPISFVVGSVRPILFSAAFSFLFGPLSDIDRSIVEFLENG